MEGGRDDENEMKREKKKGDYNKGRKKKSENGDMTDDLFF